MDYINSFDPIVDENSEIIILGSIPGVESLKQNQYYAYKRNAFWKLIVQLFEEPFTEDYAARLKMILRNHLALWDVINLCRREGSLDSNINNEIANDFDQFFKDHPKIKHVFFNGQKAYATFKKKVGFDFEGITFTRLESTSPANTIKFEKKLKNWSQIIEV